MRLARWTLAAFLTALSFSHPALAEPPAPRDPLLDHLVGKWILRGTIAGKPTVHDVAAEWVLNRGYVQLHEVSREKDASGRPAYEAIVYVGVDPSADGYACLWLDSTGGGGLEAQAIGHAKRGGDQLEFIFKSASSSVFHTTFAFDSVAGSWRWLMDEEAGGKLTPFARVTLAKS